MNNNNNNNNNINNNNNNIQERIIKCDGGMKHSIILTETGKVYTSGSNKFGELGIGNDIINDQIQFQLIDSKYFNNENIIQICSGLSHSMVLSENGNVYSWGINLKGQTGLKYVQYVYTPKQIPNEYFNN